jgi:hypothetical protein
MWSLSLPQPRLAPLGVGLFFGCLFGCSGSDPLGGQYGGTTTLVGPNRGNDEGGAPPSDAGQEAGDAAGAGDAPAPPAIDGAHAPTWTVIYESFLTTCATCHNQMTSAPGAYSWLESEGYISGASSPLVTSLSCLSWYGGNMPPLGGSNPEAVSDMSAWARAGAPND